MEYYCDVMGLIFRKPERPEARRLWEELEYKRKIVRPKITDHKPEKRTALSPKELIERINSIWGFESKEIMPGRNASDESEVVFENDEIAPLRNMILKLFGVKHKVSGSLAPKYNIVFDSRIKGAEDIEILKILGYLLLPEEYFKRLLKRNPVLTFFGMYDKGEQSKQINTAISKLLTDNRTDNYYSEAYRVQNSATIFGISLFIPFLWSTMPTLFLPKPITKRIELSFVRRNIERLYDAHGIDGLLLFLVYPPRAIGAIETSSWRKRMINNQLLLPNGGLTERGIEFIKKVLPKERIYEKIKEMKELTLKR